MRTLEIHVSTLQERLLEVEEERRLHAERAEAERAAVLEREAELRRVKQREYAEQQLRVEAEDRLTGADRESRGQIERLNRRLSASEQEARELAQRLESVQRALAEAEQAAAAERTAVRRAERELQARLTELECRALEIHRALSAERGARERSERTLESIRRGHRMVEGIVGETRAIVGRLAAAFAHPQEPAPRAHEPVLERSAPPAQPPAEPLSTTMPGVEAQARSEEMADALAAAVERLRARAEEPLAEARHESVTVAGGQAALAAQAPRAPVRPARGPSARAVVFQPVAPEMPPPPPPTPAQHKHSLSWIGRWRMRRKQRRAR